MAENDLSPGLEINPEIFEKKVISDGSVSLVCFLAGWCGPSGLQEPIIRKLALDFKEKAVIGTVDVDQHETLARRFTVKTLPTSLIFNEGKLVETMVGFQADEYLRPYMEFLLAERERVSPPR